MNVSYESFPRLLFFKKEDTKVDIETFKDGILSFIRREYPVLDLIMEYGAPLYDAPDRENQFTGGYRRSVYATLLIEGGKKISLHFYDEESGESDFQKASVFSFYCLSLYFVEGQDWNWMHSCWLKMKPLLDAFQFYDATFRFSFIGGLYQFFQERADKEAMSEIVGLTEADVKSYLEIEVRNVIEIQHKPFLDIQALLQGFPNKEGIQFLHLPHNELAVWPEAIFEFTELVSLDIYYNLIDHCDERLSALTKLRQINIHHLPLAQNPTEMRLLHETLPKECVVMV